MGKWNWGQEETISYSLLFPLEEMLHPTFKNIYKQAEWSEFLITDFVIKTCFAKKFM